MMKSFTHRFFNENEWHSVKNAILKAVRDFDLLLLKMV